MKQRKIPLRKDLLTDEMLPKKEMVRIVLNKEGELSVDPTGKKPGRGAYVSLKPEVIQEAQKKQIIEKALKTKVSPDFYQELFDYVDHKKARLELFGEN
ncbi:MULTISPECIES: RNase P modulator RnpM [Amylolactobacillus]|nr:MULTISPECIES: YlxR family protein [Amylolactobacillus]APT19266.1 DNA-binding protein [Amylolactobacillus amylophilus DSM 20533 = JCM 1125]GED79794.1 DNA-binding protein [Amylolactobacillus amylophilus]